MLRQVCQFKLEFFVSSVLLGLSVLATRSYLLLDIMKLLLHLLLQCSKGWCTHRRYAPGVNGSGPLATSPGALPLCEPVQSEHNHMEKYRKGPAAKLDSAQLLRSAPAPIPYDFEVGCEAFAPVIAGCRKPDFVTISNEGSS